MENPDKINRKSLSNLCKFSLEHGGDISKLTIPSTDSLGDGLTNGSLLYHDNKWLLNLRRVGYLLYHSENNQKFPSPWGPLVYLNPEDDIVLRTINYVCELDSSFEIAKHFKTNTDFLDEKPKWEFIGLEDARLQYWDKKLYQTGVRRDTTTNGEGRMELSTIKKLTNEYKELERVRISPPDPRTHAQGGSYCEKNWMPINDMPNHYIKWTTPTEVVKVDPKKGTSEVVHLVEQPNLGIKRDPRGSSNVIKYKDYWVAIIHEVDLWFNQEEQKDSIYYHRFIVWDKDWNIVFLSDEFDFMTGRIEFTCGLGFEDNKFLIPFGFQDSTSFMLQLPADVFEYITKMTNKKPKGNKKIISNNKRKSLYNFIDKPFDYASAFNLAEEYYKEGHWASALSFYLRAAEYTDDKTLQYDSYFMVCRCLANKGGRPDCELKMWHFLTDIDPHRPEGYQAIVNYHAWRGNFHEAYIWCSLALNLTKKKPKKIGNFIPIIGTTESLKVQKNLFGGNSYGKINEKIAQLGDYVMNLDNDISKYPYEIRNWAKIQAEKYKLLNKS